MAANHPLTPSAEDINAAIDVLRPASRLASALSRSQESASLTRVAEWMEQSQSAPDWRSHFIAFGAHDEDCAVHGHYGAVKKPGPCDCGFLALLDAARATAPERAEERP